MGNFNSNTSNATFYDNRVGNIEGNEIANEGNKNDKLNSEKMYVNAILIKIPINQILSRIQQKAAFKKICLYIGVPELSNSFRKIEKKPNGLSVIFKNNKVKKQFLSACRNRQIYIGSTRIYINQYMSDFIDE